MPLIAFGLIAMVLLSLVMMGTFNDPDQMMSHFERLARSFLVIGLWLLVTVLILLLIPEAHP